MSVFVSLLSFTREANACLFISKANYALSGMILSVA